MRVAILTTSYPRAPGDPAGHFIETEAFELARAGHDVHVIAPGRRASVRCPRRDESSICVWGAGGESLFGSPGALIRARERPHRLFDLVRFVPSVRRLLGALAPIDRTVAHFLVPCGYPLALVPRRGELDVVLHGSDVRLVLGVPAPLRSHLVANLLSRGARFRFVSEELMSRLVSSLSPIEGERLRRASRVEMPHIDVWRGREGSLERETASTQVGRARWVVCSRLIESKRVDRAIREAARRNVELTVVGDGPLRAELEALAASLAPRARFVGHLSRDKALDVIAGSHKLIHLSETEGAPTVIREARALGVSVLATPVGDVPRWAADDPGIEIFRPT